MKKLIFYCILVLEFVIIFCFAVASGMYEGNVAQKAIYEFAWYHLPKPNLLNHEIGLILVNFVFSFLVIYFSRFISKKYFRKIIVKISKTKEDFEFDIWYIMLIEVPEKGKIGCYFASYLLLMLVAAALSLSISII